MIRVLVVDDHAMIREGLKRILTASGDMVVAEAADDREALDQLHTASCDVVVTDISMPGRGGLELLANLKRRYPRLPVVILSVHGEEHLAIRVLKAGAAGYLTKDSAPDELLHAVRRAQAGGVYVGVAMAEKLARHIGRGDGGVPHERLSTREFQVLQGIGAGKTVKEIADEMCLSMKTVSTYRTRILAKMGMRSTAAVMAYAIRNGLVP